MATCAMVYIPSFNDCNDICDRANDYPMESKLEKRGFPLVHFCADAAGLFGFTLSLEVI